MSFARYLSIFDQQVISPCIPIICPLYPLVFLIISKQRIMRSQISRHLPFTKPHHLNAHEQDWAIQLFCTCLRARVPFGHVHAYIHTHIYIYINNIGVCIYLCVFMYVYIYMCVTVCVHAKYINY